MSYDERQRWAQLRFAIVGPLLAAPPQRGELQGQLKALAARTWRHPTSGEDIRFGVSTVERWYYAAMHERLDTVGALRGKRRSDAGRHRHFSQAMREALVAQHRAHPGWSVQLHYDNLATRVAGDDSLGPLPSYATVRRYYHAQGLRKRSALRRKTAGRERAMRHLEQREVRSYEIAHVHALWHADGHIGSRRVLDEQGRWQPAILIGVLDDASRLCCHAQWYHAESAQTFAHCLSQALQKRGLPRALMTDNGSAETAAEITQGLARLGIVHQTTLPYSAYMNAKQESFWGRIEGRVMAMLEGVEPLTLALLNEATLAWIEREYHRQRHGELACTPHERALAGPDVARECPDAAVLRGAFRADLTRRQRRSDGTCTVDGVRYEVPSRYRHLQSLRLRRARWERAGVDLIDPDTGEPVATLYPLDRQRNAENLRRALAPLDNGHRVDDDTATGDASATAMAPLLASLMAEYAATGLPPAYLAFDDAGGPGNDVERDSEHDNDPDNDNKGNTP